jgi:hypothetical protein
MVIIERLELGLTGIRERSDMLCKFFRTRAAIGPVTALKNLNTKLITVDPYRINLGRGIRNEFVYRYDGGHAELSNVSKMPTQVFQPIMQSTDTFGIEVRFRDTSMHFESSGSSNKHDRIRLEACFTAFNIEKLLGTKVRTKTGLSHYVIGKLESHFGRSNRITSMGNISERPAVNDGRIILKGLNQVWHKGVAQQCRHGAFGFEVTGMNRLSQTGISHNDVTQPALQISEIFCETEDRHKFRGHCNIKTTLSGEPVGDTAERHRDLAKRAVIHINDPTPGHPALVNRQLITPVDVILY